MLAVHAGGIGDLLLTCPALIQLAEEGPLELLGRSERLALAVHSGIAAAAHDLDTSGFESLFGEPNDRMRGLLARFARCVVWMRDDDGVLARGIRRCGVKDVRTFPGVPPQGWTEHASDYYLRCLGFSPREPLYLPFTSATPRHDVILHPGSGGQHKNWPLDKYAALARALEHTGRGVTWCTGPAEEAWTLPEGAPLLRVADLIALARELAGARQFIGNDGGITHLAAAAGCKTAVIFGPEDPRVWAPRGEHVTVIQGNPWPDVNDVLYLVA